MICGAILLADSRFVENPILNTPYAEPTWHWALDARGQPLPEKREGRRPHRYVVPVARSRKGAGAQEELGLDAEDRSDNTQVKLIRPKVDAWRKLPPSQWNVTPETERLLRWWRDQEVRKYPFFFCQLEAVETIIWLTEVASKDFRDKITQANDTANPGLFRIAAKMATGSGKTTVMSMLIAWQAINAARRPTSSRFTNAFLVIAPGITIRDRLRVLQPEEPNNYYEDPDRRIVPPEMVQDLRKARIVITNYHAFQLRETMSVASGARPLIGERKITEYDDGSIDVTVEPKRFIETEGQMIARVAPELMASKRIIVLNDEAHHCYREKPGEPDEGDIKDADEKDEAKQNSEAARIWISGVEALAKKLELLAVYDVSATPFFLRGSGFGEGTLFPWVVSDFSLMDAIECGIVKTPRLPVLDDAVQGDSPKYRALYQNLPKNALPKKGRSSGKILDPEELDELIRGALEALYKHYEKTSAAWHEAGIVRPPVFIVVANNTATSKLIYDFIAGYEKQEGDQKRWIPGKLAQFSNVDPQYLKPVASPRTILIDSEALESSDSLPDDFKKVAAQEIDDFRREVERRDGPAAAAKLTDAQVLREVMNTVGQPGKLGAKLYKHLLGLPMAYFSARRVGDSVARVRELETIREFLTSSSITVLIDGLFTVVFLVVMYVYSPTLLLVVLVSLPLYVLILWALSPVLKRRLDEKFARGADNQAFLVESVTNVETAKAMAVEPAFQQRWEKQLAGYVQASFKALQIANWGSEAVQLVSKLCTAVILFVGAKLVMESKLSVGELVAFNMFAGRVSGPVLRLAQLAQQFQQVKIAIDRLGDILNTPTEPQFNPGRATLPKIRGTIAFDGVTFRYSPQAPEVLRNIHLTIGVGERLGIVGSSGSGKSTLTKLIQRLHVPDSGRVLVDGVDLAQVDPSWLRRQVGVVLQENRLFNRTVRDNIALADPAASMAVIEQAARLAGAHEFILALPEGYDTVVSEGGMSLSGGQRQRIAIARALLTDPRILILDEATSALDAESEEIIQTNLALIAKQRTVIIIAHRLSAVRSCDRIITVEKGQIIEEGSHADLLALGGRYAQLHAKQMGNQMQDQNTNPAHAAGAA